MGLEELTDINKYLLLYGYKELEKFVIDNKLINVIYNISNIDLDEITNVRRIYKTKSSIKREAANFLNRYFQLHDVKTITSRNFRKILKSDNVYSVDDLVHLFDKSSKFSSPFNIPVRYLYEDIFDGSLIINYPILPDEYSSELLSKLNVIFSEIILPKILTNFSGSIYIHEVIHSQLQSNKGIVSDYFNSEILSIFFELLYLYNYNFEAYKIDLELRVENLLECFNSIYSYKNNKIDEDYEEFDYYSDIKYLVSTFKVLNLLDVYFKTNNKKYMISRIQEIFNGNLSLEMFLKDIDVSYESSLSDDFIKKLLRK